MYVAFKVNDKKSVILPILYDCKMQSKNQISHDLVTLENPSNIQIDKNKEIVEIDNDGEMLIIVMNSVPSLSLNSIVLFTIECTGLIVHDYLKVCITNAARLDIHKLSENNCGFTPLDCMTDMFSRRKWPISSFSPPSWKQLNTENGNTPNWLINIVKTQMTKDDDAKRDGTEPEQPYDFLAAINIMDLDAELKTSIDDGNTKLFAALALKLEHTHIVDEYLLWLVSTDIPKKHCKLATSIGYKFLTAPNTITKRGTMRMKKYDTVFSKLSEKITVLRNLYKAGMINEFMVYVCTMLTRPIYVKILREIDIISLIKKIMIERPLFTDMVGVAMSYAMYYTTRYEFDTTRFNAMVDDPYVWNIDAAASFPSFECSPGSHPFIQMGLRYFKLFSPWTIIDFNRRIVTSEEAYVRMDTTAIRPGKKLSFIKIMPWCSLKLAFTGSRMGTCGAILPQEGSFKDFDEYIEKYVGTSEHQIDIAISEFNDMKTNDIEVAIDGDDANVTISEVFEECKNMSDIDIQFSGDFENFDNVAKLLVNILRRYGTVFMVKRKKYGNSYSWTIFADFMRYPIDLFYAKRSSIRLIVGFMTGYPRIYYNGTEIIVTSHYVCARVTGINIWYERMMMNDPIKMFVKSVVQEQVSMLMNFNEIQMLEKWLEKNEIEDEIVFGNVSTKNAIFWKGKSNAPKPLNSERHWLKTRWLTPDSNIPIPIWDGTELIIYTSHIFDRFWYDIIKIQGARARK
jgi:hypothetical protein